MDQQLDLFEGALDMPILKAVSLGPLDGYGVLLAIWQISEHQDRLEIQLYPAPYRLEHQGWIASQGGESENQQDYRLTTAGKRFQTEAEKGNRKAEVVSGIMVTTQEEV